MIRLYKENGKYYVEINGKVKRFDNLADAWAYAFKFLFDKEEKEK